MKAMQWTFIDKSAWPRGPWDDEPDKMQWLDEATGLPCLIVRGPLAGALCGYVGVPEGHPCFGVEYDAPGVDVHGGLTFAGPCDPDRAHGICHVVEPGEPDGVWWLGFDCAHGGDLAPAFEAALRDVLGDEYRDLDYVRAECARLAAQLAEDA
jgi:hypothetical protein